jgi:hypothetical protein
VFNKNIFNLNNFLKFREIFKKFGTYGSAVMTGMSLENYIRGLKKDLVVDPAVKNLADSYEQLTNTTKELADKNIVNEVTKAKIETYGEVGRRSMDKVQSSFDKIHNLNEQLHNENVSTTDKTNIENQLSNANSELKNGLVEVNDTLKSIIEVVKGDDSSSSHQRCQGLLI